MSEHKTNVTNVTLHFINIESATVSNRRIILGCIELTRITSSILKDVCSVSQWVWNVGMFKWLVVWCLLDRYICCGWNVYSCSNMLEITIAWFKFSKNETDMLMTFVSLISIIKNAVYTTQVIFMSVRVRLIPSMLYLPLPLIHTPAIRRCCVCNFNSIKSQTCW